MTNIEKSVKQLVEPIINNIGYNVYDVIYEKEGQDNYLRIFIDKDGIIDLNDCEKVNDAITDVLDEKDIIKNQYMLEVSSPGLERRIRDDEQLKQNINNLIEVHTYKKIDICNENEEIKNDNESKLDKLNIKNKVNKQKKIKDKNSKLPDDKSIQGVLIEFDDSSITVLANKNKIKIDKNNISTLKTVYNWEE